MSVRETAARALFAWNTGRTPYFVITSEFGREVDADDPYQPITDAVLAAVADHDGLADVLVKHGRYHTAVVGDDLWCATCDRIIGHADHREDHHAAHLADVVRAWLRGES